MRVWRACRRSSGQHGTIPRVGKPNPDHWAYTPDLDNPSSWRMPLRDDAGVLDPKKVAAALGCLSPDAFPTIPSRAHRAVRQKVRDAWLRWRVGLDENELAIKRMLATGKAQAELDAAAQTYDDSFRAGRGDRTRCRDRRRSRPGGVARHAAVPR